MPERMLDRILLNIAFFVSCIILAFAGHAQTTGPVAASQPVVVSAESAVPVAVSSTTVAAATPAPIILDSLEISDMDIKDVLKLIARKSGLNIISGSSVNGRVSIFIQNVEVRDALRIILDANKLAFVEDLGIIRVMPAADYEQLYGRPFGRDTETRVISLLGVKAVDIVPLLNHVRSPQGRIVADDQSNTILAIDTPDKIREIENYIHKIDRSTQMTTFSIQYLQVEALALKIQEILTPKLGSVRFDTRSNKLFVTDSKEKLEEIEVYVNEVDIKQQTKVIDLSYAQAEDIQATVRSLITEGLGSIEIDTRSNQIIVRDTISKINAVQDVVAALDHKEDEVLIEARIIQVVLQDSLRMGIDWEAVIPDYHDLSLQSDFGGLGSTASNKGILSIGTLSSDNYTAVLEALATTGDTTVLSNPSIAVVNNKEAKILIGTTKPYVTTTTVTPSSGPTTISETINFIDVGVKLVVTPTIHHDGFVTMKIRPEVSNAATSLTTSSANEIPIVDTSTVETTVRVRDGVTIVIGGLMKNEKADIVKKVPILGGLPVIGGAFRNVSQNTDKTEIVIFLTPKIISGDVNQGLDYYLDLVESRGVSTRGALTK